MREIILNLTAMEPLAITDGSAESMAHATLPWIPGNMILGALACRWAALHKNQCPDDSPAFQSLFLAGGAYFGHAYPMAGAEAGLPVPKTWLRIKNRPALPMIGEASNKPQEKFFVCDSLYLGPDDTIEKLYFGESKPDGILKTKRIPPGFMDARTFAQPSQGQTWNIHVALGEQRAGLNGLLFGFSALAMGSRFQSRIYCQTESEARELETLLAATPSFWVGHGRSAGYGRVRASFTGSGADFKPDVLEGDSFILYLRSQYMPSPSWEDPIGNLLSQLMALVQARPQIERQHADFCQIQGYNNMWKKPRPSRVAIEMGSVFKIRFERSVRIQRHLFLGSDLGEGYGRLEVNPPFLAGQIGFLDAPQLAPAAKASLPDLKPSPALRLLRKRALDRVAEIQAASWIHLPAWLKFLNSLKGESRPSPSQRNNLRSLTEKQFEEMLKKTPGEQWSRTVAWSPFDDMNEVLAKIIKKLLSKKTFIEHFPADQWDLPGAKPDEREKMDFESRAYKLFILYLISFWNKQSRTEKK